MACAALLGTLLLPAPARAGQYELVPGYPQGQGTLKMDSSQGSTNESLTQPNFSRTLQDGSLDYTYTETFVWEWKTDPGKTLLEDPPVEVRLALPADTTLDFTPLSGLGDAPGNASSSLSVDSDSRSATASGGPGLEYVEAGTGARTLAVEVVLFGLRPIHTNTYTGSLDATGGIDGLIEFARSLPGGKYIVIDSAAGNRPGLLDEMIPVNLAGRWSTVPDQPGHDYGVTESDYKIEIFYRQGTEKPWRAGTVLNDLTGIPSNWSATIRVPHVGYYERTTTRAVLICKLATGGWVQGRPEAMTEDVEAVRWR